jgi:hypothetical protein
MRGIEGAEQTTQGVGPSPLISESEWSALRLGSRALSDIAAALARCPRPELAEESARNAEALDALRRRAVVMFERSLERGDVER